MTPDQKAKLEARRAALLEILIAECDPAAWPTMETKEGRGDRAWFKTNAVKTATLIVKIEDLCGLRGVLRSPLGGNPDGEDLDESDTAGASAAADERDVDKLIKDAGKKVARIRDGSKKQKG